ncbi:MAG: hypothetical protein C5B53_06580 [Candidatus Melainabacteria bacterium]|nr:MAG: hypothetical protein C5B53_06580 [Candidatus Melainabacteria bacterium]
MDDLILSIKKRVLFPTVFLLGLITWLVLCRAFYHSYWEGTIYRVQTVDFNLLHHVLPATLSQLIVADRDDLIQKVLDANYGIFGLAVTDSQGRSILYATRNIYSSNPERKNLTVEDLSRQTEPADWLCDPPPLEPQWRHNSASTPKAVRLGSKPPGKILGKVYYLRQEQPTFERDLYSFLTTCFYDLSGSKRGYFFISLMTFGFSLIAILLIWLRRRGLELKQQELEHVSRELELRKRALDQLSAELTVQKARKFWLEREAEESYRRALNLKQALEKLRDSINPESQQGRQALPPAGTSIKVRPPVHPPSAILEEIEALIPELDRSANTLKSQAGLLHDYCAMLEQRQKEMQRIVQEASEDFGMSGPGMLDMKAG